MTFIKQNELLDYWAETEAQGISRRQATQTLADRGHILEGVNDTPKNATKYGVKYVRKPVDFVGDLKEIGNAVVGMGKEAIVGAGSLPARVVGGAQTLLTGKTDISKRVAENIKALEAQLGTQSNMDRTNLDPEAQKKLIDAGRLLGEVGITLPIGGATAVEKTVGAVKKVGEKVPVVAKSIATKAQQTATKNAKTAGAIRTSVTSKVSGIDPVLLQEAKTNPLKIEKALKTVKDSPRGSFHEIAKRTAGAIKNLRDSAQKAFTTAKKPFVESNRTFDLSKKLPEVTAKLNETSPLVKITQLRDKTGKLTSQFRVEAPVGILDTKEQKIIQGMVDRIRTAKKMTPDAVLNLRSELGSFYESLPSVAGKSTPAQKIAKQLMGDTIQSVEAILPKELSGAYSMYRKYYDIYDKLGKKLLDSKGNLKTTAEGILSSSAGNDKEQMRNLLRVIGEELGIDINTEVANITAIKKMLGQPISGQRLKLTRSGVVDEALAHLRDLVAGKETVLKRYISAGKKLPSLKK